jgi:hypothetical protein
MLFTHSFVLVLCTVARNAAVDAGSSTGDRTDDAFSADDKYFATTTEWTLLDIWTLHVLSMQVHVSRPSISLCY